MFQIKGKVVLILGVGRGLTVELARQLLINQCKAVVIAEPISDRGRLAVQQLKDEFGEMRVTLLQVDITITKELEDVFLTTIKLFNRLDIVINNIGVVDEGDIDRSMHIGMLTAMRSTKLAVNVYLPQYKLDNEAVVININCVVSLGSNVGTLTGLTGGVQYERNNVRVISLYIGCSRTDMLTGLMTNNLVQTIGNISDLKVHSGIETFGRALIGAIEQGSDGSSWVGLRQHDTDTFFRGNLTLNQMKL